MKEKIVIICAGGFGREVFCLINRDQYFPVGFIDPHPDGHRRLPAPILGDDSYIPELRRQNLASCACVALANLSKRKCLFGEVLKSGLKLPPIIHSTAAILTGHPLGEGTIVYPNAVVMNDCKIGRGVLINAGVTIGHDVEVGDFSTINPGAHVAGNVKIGQQVMIGIGATILENLRIGDGAIIGAGSVLLADVSPGDTVYGIPARPCSHRSNT